MIVIRSPSRSASDRSCVMKTIVLSTSRLQADHLVLHVAPDQRVERPERLVEQQDLGVGRGRGPGRRAAACHRKLIGLPVLEAAETDQLDHLLRPRLRSALATPWTSSP